MTDEELLKIKKELDKQKKKKAQMLYQAETYQKTHGSEFFRPLKYQQLLIDYMLMHKKRLMLQGANQIGKTLIGSVLVVRGQEEYRNGTANRVYLTVSRP
jgi:hypothetical protein